MKNFLGNIFRPVASAHDPEAGRERILGDGVQGLGAAAIRETENQQNGEASNSTLEGVLDMLDEVEFTEGMLDKLVAQFNIPEEEKDKVRQKCLRAGNYNALGDAVEYYSMSEKERKQVRAMQRMKPFLGVALAASIFVGGGAVVSMLRSNSAQAQEGSGDPYMPTGEPKIESVDESYVDEDEISVPEQEAEEESNLFDQSLYSNYDLDKYDLGSLGSELAEQFVDRGEGFEELNGMQANFDADYNKFEEKSSQVAFDTEFTPESIAALENGDRIPFVKEFMNKAANNPGALAAHLAKDEYALKELGVPDDVIAVEMGQRSQAVYNWMKNNGMVGEQGEQIEGSAYENALAVMFVGLMDEKTEFEVLHDVNSFDYTEFMAGQDPSKPMDIENVKLVLQESIKRKDATQIKIRKHYRDGNSGDGGDGGNGGGNDVVVEYIVNAKCFQPTGRVTMTLRVPNTGEEFTVTFELKPEEKQETKENTTVSTKETDTQQVIETIKAKSNVSVREGVANDQTTAGSQQQVVQSENYVNPSGNGIVVSTDGTAANVVNGNVVLVTDGESSDAVGVIGGENQAAGAETVKDADEVAAAVNEGQKNEGVGKTDLDKLLSDVQQ